MTNGILDSSQKIVTDGLVLNYDIAQLRSYPTIGTAVTDLSGSGYTGTLVNGVAFSSNNGGSLVFDGLNDRVSRTTTINVGSDFTVSAWIFPTLLGTIRRCVVGNSSNYSLTNGWTFSTGSNNSFFLSIGADVAYRTAPANTLTTNTWTCITGVVSGGGSNIVLYKNGIALTTYAASLLTSNTIIYVYPEFNIGFRDTVYTLDPYTGRIAQVQLYNIALTETEVLQNFNANRSRYGL